jgi:tetratricopeptide (TPR) repeat protein
MAQTVELPPNFSMLEPYKTFVAGKKTIKQMSIRLPQSDYLLIYIAIERTEDKAMWSVSPADGLVAKIFAYHSQKNTIDISATAHINKWLGADKYYQPNFCGGLGSLESWTIENNKVVLSQIYAPASEIIDCTDSIYYDGKNILTSKSPVIAATDGLAGMAGKERNKKNEEALKLLQNKKIAESIKIWKELYGYIKNGPYATEGKIDEYLNNLGFAYWKSKNYKESEKILLECKTRFPSRYVVYINLADLYRDTKNKAKAVEYYTKIKTTTLSDKQKKYAEEELKKLK